MVASRFLSSIPIYPLSLYKPYIILGSSISGFRTQGLARTNGSVGAQYLTALKSGLGFRIEGLGLIGLGFIVVRALLFLFDT